MQYIHRHVSWNKTLSALEHQSSPKYAYELTREKFKKHFENVSHS